MYRVTVRAEFSAAHRLRSADGEYEPLHDHDWTVEASFVGADLDATGMLVDFEEVRPALQSVTQRLDHSSLNEAPLLAGLNPSAENVARVICEALAGAIARPDLLESVRVTEAPGCTAAYYRAASPRCSSDGRSVDDTRGGL
ncbi:MAG TPA: 6-carboxytetrahydropterin synthase [Phycisphaerae bacterium]|nr:6-carboxytetrahydropterin synthase [Phycisphaerae bacterium]